IKLLRLEIMKRASIMACAPGVTNLLPGHDYTAHCPPQRIPLLPLCVSAPLCLCVNHEDANEAKAPISRGTGSRNVCSRFRGAGNEPRLLSPAGLKPRI